MIGRQQRNISRRQPETGHGHGHIGFAAAKGRDELRRLQESLKSGRRQPQHDFAKGNRCFGHDLSIL